MRFYLFLALALVSCKKEPDQNPVFEEPKTEPLHSFVLTGQILDSCSGMPVVGKVLALWGDFINKPSIFGQTTPAIFLQLDTSDLNGEFEFKVLSLGKKYPYSIRFKDTSRVIATDIYLAKGELTIEQENQRVDIGRCYQFGFKKQITLTINNQTKFLGARLILSSSNTISNLSDTIVPHPDSSSYMFSKRFTFSLTDMSKPENFQAFYVINWGNKGLLSDTSQFVINSQGECSIDSASFFVERK